MFGSEERSDEIKKENAMMKEGRSGKKKGGIDKSQNYQIFILHSE